MKFTQIAFGAGNGESLLFALDDAGRIWRHEYPGASKGHLDSAAWVQVPSPITADEHPTRLSDDNEFCDHGVSLDRSCDACASRHARELRKFA